MEKEWLYGKNLAELEEIALAMGMKRFAGRQMADWLYGKEVRDIDGMTNLSRSFREALAGKYTVGEKAYSDVQQSSDGTRKYLFGTEKGGFVESVFIPDRERGTLCISSQAGCRMGCAFCMTGRQGLQHSLGAGEILNQIRGVDEHETLTNVVYMGMGEPLDNADNVLKSIEILTAPWGYGWSPGRITLSTIGVIPALRRYLDGCQAHLTVSLHAADPFLRRELMPVQRKYPAEEVINLLRAYDFTHQRRLSFGYILFDGLNDAPEDADRIARLLRPLGRVRVNLIPFHEIPDSALHPVPRERMERFRDYLSRKGLIVTIRTSRGQDIDAACGLLSTKKQNQK